MGSYPAIRLFHASPTSLVAIVFLLRSAVCHRAVIKPILIALVLLSSVLAYFSHAYGIVFDEQMIAQSYII